MNTIESILNDIDELLEDSWSLPLSGGRCVVDAEKVRDLIDSIRMNMPAEIKQARAVVADRNQILSLAKGEAEALIRKAEERAKQLLEQESIEPTDWLTKVSALEQRMDDMTEEYRRNQMKRMKQGSCSDEACIIFSELLTDFERIGDHALNIAQERAGIATEATDA